MQIKATLDHGQVTFEQPIKLRHDPLPILIIIADDEVVKDDDKFIESSLSPETLSLIDQLSNVLGPDYNYKDNGKTDKERFADELNTVEKYK